MSQGCRVSADGHHHFERLTAGACALLYMQRWLYVNCQQCMQPVLILLKRKQRLVLIRD